ncbi:cystathionine beta-lyase [Thalassobaculum sp.]|uniref:cystathionine beta-lyase n=1 Tax=Thalassobaculum sp. TaxID=2022740 RepID=UPI0032ECC043
MHDWKGKTARTRLVHAGRHPHDNHGVVNPPVYHASTILQPSLAVWEASRKPDFQGYRYGRAGTPTSRSFEEAVADLYGAADAVAVSSGMAAIACALMAVLKAGDHVLMTDSTYFPTRKFCDQMLSRYGVETTYYDPRIGAGISALLKPNTRAVYTEAPGSLTFEMQDIPAIAEAAHAHGAVVLTDNTWGTALHFDAFAKGVDIVVEAVTKYICGHSDVMMGMIASTQEYAGTVRDMVRLHGNCCGPDDLYLAQRGLRSMAVRLKQNEANGLELARWLEGRPEVSQVLHPGLPSHPDHALWQRDFTGACGLFAFVLKPVPRAALAAFLDGLGLYGMGASWGGFESLILPGDPKALRTATTWDDPGQLLRIHAGLEDVADLIADLDAGFERLNAAAQAAA